MGTHIDAPNHFHKSGKKIIDFSPEDLLFHKPQLIDIDLTLLNEISHSTLVDKINIESALGDLPKPVLRGKEVIIPRSNYIFKKNDIIVFLVKKDQIPLVENIFRISSV